MKNSTALYLRLSRDDGSDAESNSIGNQRELLRRYAKEHKLSVFDEYVDDGWSGTSFDRPSFQRMIEDAEAGKVATILVKDLSRLGRNNAMVAYYTEMFFPDNDIRFVAVNDSIDSARGENEIMGFKSIINEWYARDISKKVRSSMKTMAQNGKYVGSNPPYGYRLDPNDRHHLVTDETAAPVVREIFNWAAEGVNCNQIAIRLSERKLPTPRAYAMESKGVYQSVVNPVFYNEWNPQTVRSILRNLEYCGHLVAQKQTTKSFKNQKQMYRPREEWVIVRDTHAALVKEVTFEKVQGILQTKHRENTLRVENIFAGLTKCADCGRAMTYNCRDGKSQRFVCNYYRKHSRLGVCTPHLIPYDALYQAIEIKLKYAKASIAAGNKELRAFHHNCLMEGIEVNQHNAQRELEKGRQRMLELDTIVRQLFEQNALGKITESRFQKMSAEYEAEQAALEASLKALRGALSKDMETLRDAGLFTEAIEQYSEGTELTASLLRDLIDKIVIHESEGKKNEQRRQKIDVVWRFVGLSDA
ncbi:MAG: recombinase family protein [Oscillospiraceae bacterium]|nr:recombinase family protein [Oscillospiraceae bacterium]